MLYENKSRADIIGIENDAATIGQYYELVTSDILATTEGLSEDMAAQEAFTVHLSDPELFTELSQLFNAFRIEEAKKIGLEGVALDIFWESCIATDPVDVFRKFNKWMYKESHIEDQLDLALKMEIEEVNMARAMSELALVKAKSLQQDRGYSSLGSHLKVLRARKDNPERFKHEALAFAAYRSHIIDQMTDDEATLNEAYFYWDEWTLDDPSQVLECASDWFYRQVTSSADQLLMQPTN